MSEIARTRPYRASVFAAVLLACLASASSAQRLPLDPLAPRPPQTPVLPRPGGTVARSEVDEARTGGEVGFLRNAQYALFLDRSAARRWLRPRRGRGARERAGQIVRKQAPGCGGQIRSNLATHE